MGQPTFVTPSLLVEVVVEAVEGASVRSVLAVELDPGVLPGEMVGPVGRAIIATADCVRLTVFRILARAVCVLVRTTDEMRWAVAVCVAARVFWIRAWASCVFVRVV